MSQQHSHQQRCLSNIHKAPVKSGKCDTTRMHTHTHTHTHPQYHTHTHAHAHINAHAQTSIKTPVTWEEKNPKRELKKLEICESFCSSLSSSRGSKIINQIEGHEDRRRRTSRSQHERSPDENTKMLCQRVPSRERERKSVRENGRKSKFA